jgi:hypothetical protein
MSVSRHREEQVVRQVPFSAAFRCLGSPLAHAPYRFVSKPFPKGRSKTWGGIKICKNGVFSSRFLASRRDVPLRV